jgi:hypothetical protein
MKSFDDLWEQFDLYNNFFINGSDSSKYSEECPHCNHPIYTFTGRNLAAWKEFIKQNQKNASQWLYKEMKMMKKKLTVKKLLR